MANLAISCCVGVPTTGFGRDPVELCLGTLASKLSVSGIKSFISKLDPFIFAATKELSFWVILFAVTKG